jgi:arginyl-tRNA--protein-N-Asp/Glu arginylyltransferase
LTVFTPDQLDEALALGHFRIGTEIVTLRYLVHEGVLRSVVWTRLPLKRYRERESHARRLRRVRSRFDVRVEPYVPTAAHEALYAAYRKHARGWRPDLLAQVLHGEHSVAVGFDTRQVSMWDGDRMVAFSLFDVGKRSVESLIGAYHPDTVKWGLGFVSMLAEIDWAIEQGLDYHYSGYVLPGSSAMAYKLEVGPLEAFDADASRWLPYSDLPASQHAVPRLARALSVVARPLSLYLPVRQVVYGPFALPKHDPRMQRCLEEPVFLLCGPDPDPHATIVQWSSHERVYRVLGCEQFEQDVEVMEPGGRKRLRIPLWRWNEERLVTKSPKRVVQTVRESFPEAIVER